MVRVPEKGDSVTYGGRRLEDYEVEAWNEYHAVLNKYDIQYRVLSYDRVSIHENFPEINEAFEHACAMATFYRLNKE